MKEADISGINPNIIYKDMIYPESGYLSKIDIKPEDLKRKKKSKKEKTIRNISFLIGKKRRTTKPPSDIAKISRELITKDIKQPAEIRTYLLSQGKSISEKDSYFYEMLVNSYVVNGNMRISDVLANKPIYSFYYLTDFKTKIISNDELFIRAFAYSALVRGETKEIEMSLLPYVDIDKATFASIPFVCDGKVEKGYYQDYTGTFAAVGVETLNDEQKNLLFSNEQLRIDDLKDFDKTYKVFSYGQAVVVAPEKMSVEEIKANIEKMKVFNTSGKVALDAKSFKVDDKVKFIESKFTTELFCPAFLKIPIEVPITLFIRGKYDYNHLFNILEQEFKRNKKDNFPFPPDFIYWTNIPQCFDFINMFSVTSNIGEPNKKALNDMYKKYFDIKDAFLAWKTIQIKLERMFLEFYHSFTNRVKFDNLQRLHKKIADYIHDRDLLMADESYQKILNFINEYHDICGLISNQLTKNVYELTDKLKEVLFDLDSGNSDDLLKKLRDVGYGIYRLSYFRDKKNKQKIDNEFNRQFQPSFPFILSPGAFLGNILREINIAEDPLKKIVEDRIRQKERQGISLKQQSDLLLRVMDNRDQYANDIIVRTINKYIDENKIKMSKKEKNDITNQVLNTIDPKAKSSVYKLISDASIKGVDIKTLTADDDIIRLYLDNFKLKKEYKENENKIQDLQFENQINNLKQQKSMIHLNESDSDSSGRSVVSTSAFRGGKKKKKEKKDVDSLAILERVKDDIGKNQEPVKYYADIMYYSGLFGMKPGDSEAYAANNTLSGLMNDYPISSEAFNLIIDDYHLPSADEVLQKGYNKRLKNKFNVRYDEETIRKIKAGDKNLELLRKTLKNK